MVIVVEVSEAVHWVWPAIESWEMDDVSDFNREEVLGRAWR